MQTNVGRCAPNWEAALGRKPPPGRNWRGDRTQRVQFYWDWSWTIIKSGADSNRVGRVELYFKVGCILGLSCANRRIDGIARGVTLPTPRQRVN